MSPSEDKGLVVTALPVTAVTLLEDRARVVRSGEVQLASGDTVLAIENVSPIVSDRTLSGRCSVGRVVEVVAKRRWIEATEDLPDPSRALRDESRELDRVIADLKNEIAEHDRDIEDLQSLRLKLMDEFSYDVCCGGRVDESWSEQLESIGEREEETAVRQANLRVELDSKHWDRRALQGRIEEFDREESRCGTTFLVRLADCEAGTAHLDIEYVVPNACWRPMYRARLHEESKLDVEYEAAIWQRTGEDWDDVALTFSTERPSLGTEPPTLEADELRLQDASPVVVEVREEEIHDSGLGQGKGKDPAEESGVPGVDDGGDVQVLRAKSPQTVVANGRLHRVLVSSFEAAAEVDHIAMPELAEGVFLRSRATHQGEHPLLAGPVDLIRRSGLVGRTQLAFVAPGESFELGWGVDPEIGVRRTSKRVEGKDKLLSSWSETDQRIRVHLSNLSAGDRSFRVTERIPVSEIDRVRITLDEKKTTAGSSIDDDGLVSWDVTLTSSETRDLELTYTVAQHRKVANA
ncbi:MAG: mucoidy inhibitor MuiA family protein [Planctomycetota bacterium]